MTPKQAIELLKHYAKWSRDKHTTLEGMPDPEQFTIAIETAIKSHAKMLEILQETYWLVIMGGNKQVLNDIEKTMVQNGVFPKEEPLPLKQKLLETPKPLNK